MWNMCKKTTCLCIVRSTLNTQHAASSINKRLSLTPQSSTRGSRRFSSRDLDPSTEKQRLAVERFRRSREYSETYTNLTPSESWLYKYQKVMSFVKPLNFIKDTPWTVENLFAILRRTKRNTEIANQLYDQVRYSTLGYDIGAAHFVVYRRGAVKFYGQDSWIRWTTESKYSEIAGLPFVHLDGYVVEGIDMSNIDLHYEGLDNFRPLRRLKYLSLAGNKLVDDWCLDAISNFSSLETLDLRNCPGISHRGLGVLYKLDRLQTLLIKNDAKEPSEELTLAVLNLLDYKPELIVDIDQTETLAMDTQQKQA